MIAHLEGKVLRKEEGVLVVSVGGVGYQVHVAVPTHDHCHLNEEVSIYIYTHVTESSLQLFGFRESSEMALFTALISINGIGPKLAITILSFPADRITQGILSEDIATLTEVPGVGKKVAERIILELKNKIALTHPTTQVQGVPGGEVAREVRTEAIEALQALGFTKADAIKMIENCVQEVETTEELVRYALQQK